MDRKSAFRIGGVAIAVLAAVFGPHALWYAKRPRVLSVVVVDKTVPFRNYREHAFVPWLLRTMKVVAPSGQFLLEEKSYIGYDPVRKIGQDLAPEHLVGVDMLFIADTYGVYVDDYKIPGDVAALEHSPKIYGGLSEGEAAAIEDFSARGGLVVAEFNTFASPTPELVRARVESTLGVRWTKWVGRYWPNLQDETEVPRWVGKVYERVYKAPMNFSGAGFVFVREDEDIVVLRPTAHLQEGIIHMERTKEAMDLKDLPSGSSFQYWLDIVSREDSEIIYEHVLDLTDAGKALVSQHGIPDRFPAMVRRRGRPTYYFAGDFVDSGVELGFPERYGLLCWRSMTLGHGSTTSERFLWGWYAPSLVQLINPRTRRQNGPK